VKSAYRDETLAAEDRHWWYLGRRRVVRAALESMPLPDPALCLDAGCGGGVNLSEFARFGAVVGLEPSEQALSVARARGVGRVMQGTVEEMPFDDCEFDVAAALDVVEHLDDDRAGLAELRRVVKPGGFLLVTVPAYPRLWGPHDVVNEHRRRYARRTLIAAAKASGWTPLSVSHFNSILLPVAGVRRLIDQRRSSDEITSDVADAPPVLNGLLEWPLRVEARMLAAGVRLPAGLSILAVFKRASSEG
jgi:SAM-dependent methyltransferase